MQLKIIILIATLTLSSSGCVQKSSGQKKKVTEKNTPTPTNPNPPGNLPSNPTTPNPPPSTNESSVNLNNENEEFGNLVVDDGIFSSNSSTPLIKWNFINGASRYSIAIGTQKLANDIYSFNDIGDINFKIVEDIHSFFHGFKYYATIRAYDQNQKLISQKSSDGFYYYDNHFVKASPNFSEEIEKINITQNDDYFFLGRFKHFNAVKSPYLDIIDSVTGKSTGTFIQGLGFDTQPSGFKFHNNKIYVWGNFTTYDLIPVQPIVRLNLDGSYDFSFNADSYFFIYPKARLTDLFFDSSNNLLAVINESQNYLIIDKLNPDGDYIDGTSMLNRLIDYGIIKGTDSMYYHHALNSDQTESLVEIVNLKNSNFLSNLRINFQTTTKNKPAKCKSAITGKISCFKLESTQTITYTTYSDQPDSSLTGSMDQYLEFSIDENQEITSLASNDIFTDQGILSYYFNDLYSWYDNNFLFNGSYLKGTTKNFPIFKNDTQSIDLNETFYNNVSNRNLGLGHLKHSPTHLSNYILMPSEDSDGYMRPIKINSEGLIDQNFGINGYLENWFTHAQEISENRYIILGDLPTRHLSGKLENNFVFLNKNFNQNSTFKASDFNGKIRGTVNLESSFIVYGDFTTYKGQSASRIVKILHNGTRDLNFNIGSGVNDVINQIFKLSNDQLIIVGKFTTYKGASTNGILKIDKLGNKDPYFYINTTSGENIHYIRELKNSKLIIAYANFIDLRLQNGSKDLNFKKIQLANSYNEKINIQQFSDGTFIATGDNPLKNFNGNRFIISFDTYGNIDEDFLCPNSLETRNVISSDLLTDDSMLITSKYAPFIIKKISSTCQEDTNLHFQTFTHDGYFQSIGMNSKGEIIIGGYFINNSNQTSGANLIILGQ